jgi:hypothetical protein
MRVTTHRVTQAEQSSAAVKACTALILFLLTWSCGETDTRSEGRWVCLVCGESQVRVLRNGEIVGIADIPIAGPADRARHTYFQWYAREIGDEHHHVWEASGCHESRRFGDRQVSVEVSCHGLMEDHPWFVILPKIQDRRVVARLLEEMRDAGKEERIELLRDISRRFDLDGHPRPG